MNRNFLGMLIVVFIGVIFGIAILSGVTTQTAIETNTYNVGNETHNISSALSTFGQINQSVAAANISIGANEQGNVSNVVVNNGTGAGTVTLTQGTDYLVLNNGNFNNGDYIAILNTTATHNFTTGVGNITNLSYTYQPIGYAQDQGSRTVIGLIVIFAALAIFAFTLIGIRREWFDWFG